MTTDQKVNEAIADYVAAQWMRAHEEILPGVEIEFDHCFGDESTDAKNSDASWTRLRAVVTEAHMRRAYQICRSFSYEPRALVNEPDGDPSETASLYDRMVAQPAARRVMAELREEN